MASATDAARVEPLDRVGVPDRPMANPRDAAIASGGGRPPTIRVGDPRTEIDTPTDREGAK